MYFLNMYHNSNMKPSSRVHRACNCVLGMRREAQKRLARRRCGDAHERQELAPCPPARSLAGAVSDAAEAARLRVEERLAQRARAGRRWGGLLGGGEQLLAAGVLLGVEGGVCEVRGDAGGAGVQAAFAPPALRPAVRACSWACCLGPGGLERGRAHSSRCRSPRQGSGGASRQSTWRRASRSAAPSPCRRSSNAPEKGQAQGKAQGRGWGPAALGRSTERAQAAPLEMRADWAEIAGDRAWYDQTERRRERGSPPPSSATLEERRRARAEAARGQGRKARGAVAGARGWSRATTLMVTSWSPAATMTRIGGSSSLVCMGAKGREGLGEP